MQHLTLAQGRTRHPQPLRPSSRSRAQNPVPETFHRRSLIACLAAPFVPRFVFLGVFGASSPSLPVILTSPSSSSLLSS
eukprot:scaffold3027_cov62-Phaeocystis_antarctica.AAC.1